MFTPPPSPTPTPLTLEQVKELFSHWRRTRTKISRIPSPLWDAVCHLIKDQGYSPKQVASELGLSHHKIQLKMQPSPPAPDFIQVSLPSSASLHPSSPRAFPPEGSIELTRPNGTTLKASGLDPKDLHSLVQLFLS
jgi:hypothetical protein